MDSDSFVKSMIALVAWREENRNGLNGMLGVAYIIRNRVKAGRAKGFADSYMGVITGHNQFSSMSIVGDGQTVHYPDVRDPVLQQFLFLLDDIYNDKAVDNLSHGALYYADMGSPAYVKGGWFDKTIAGNQTRFPRVNQIGTTTYFADLGELPPNEGLNHAGPKFL